MLALRSVRQGLIWAQNKSKNCPLAPSRYWPGQHKNCESFERLIIFILGSWSVMMGRLHASVVTNNEWDQTWRTIIMWQGGPGRGVAGTVRPARPPAAQHNFVSPAVVLLLCTSPRPVIFTHQCDTELREKIGRKYLVWVNTCRCSEAVLF